jgi:hypothetical protein
MKHYLLTFNCDWADEHDVPALACFDEADYNKWLKTKCGKLNPKYEEQLKAYQEWNIKRVNILNRCKEELGVNWGRVQFKDWPLDLREKYAEIVGKSLYEPSKLSHSYIYASLGNSGEGFGESFEGYYLMEELVEDKTVKVREVSEDFYNTFNSNNLSRLSLCNVFDLNLNEDYEEDEDE